MLRPGPTNLRLRAALRSLHPEAWVFVALLALLNLHVVFPRAMAPLAFQADRLAAGEWWRVLTHPFVHVSWYHLLLDGSAFLFLYAGLAEKRILRRLVLAGGSAAGALLAAASFSGESAALGFCGLSGAAHGLMAVTALEMAAGGADPALRRGGAILLAGVAAKSVLEAVTGECFFSFLHFGMMGSPVAVSHLGGFLGGVFGFAATWVGETGLDELRAIQKFTMDRGRWQELTAGRYKGLWGEMLSRSKPAPAYPRPAVIGWWPFLALSGVLVLGLAVVYVARSTMFSG